jgi:ATP-dependent Clp protease adaptor protein ClpS
MHKVSNAFFVWLSPGPGIETVREWLTGRGAVKAPWTDYLTMVHMGKGLPASASAVEVRKITREDIEAGVLGPAVDALMGGYMQSVGRSGYHHFAAFEGGQPVGGAVLIQFEEIGYLTYASTAEAFRRRGSPTALIAARIEGAHRLGCTRIIAETLTMLRDSYANLTRAGFQVAYEKEVYECVRSSAVHRSSDHEAPKLSVSKGGGESATEAAMIEVMLLNDDHTPMEFEFVVEVLERIFDHDCESATRIMLRIHHDGVAVCGTYPANVAAAKSAQVIEAASARRHPLRYVVAPVGR